MYSWLMYTNQKKQKELHNEKGKSWTQTEGRLLTKQVLQTGGTHDDGTTEESHGQLATATHVSRKAWLSGVEWRKMLFTEDRPKS